MVGNLLRRSQKRRFAASVFSNQWQESTFAEIAWEQSRNASPRWAIAGWFLGLLIGLIAFAPAAWLEGLVASVTNQRVLLSEARGSIWSGSAVIVLTGGPGSKDASALPGRLEWSLKMQGLGLALNVQHACCLNGVVTLQLNPGLGRMEAKLVPKPDWIGQWPSALLSGLGTPWNTLQLGGTLRVISPGMKMEWVRGRWRMDGRTDIELLGASSRLSTLDALGSYQLSLSSTAQSGGTSNVTLTTLDGALNLSGTGTWGPSGLRFRGTASAAEGDEPALANLLNIIGRRTGALSVISIG